MRLTAFKPSTLLKSERTRETLEFILTRLLIVFFFAIVIIYSSREIADLDLWLHLKTGEVILNSKSVPSVDIFSFTISGRPWINHEWFFQAISYCFYMLAGADGLIYMQNLVITVIFLLLFLVGVNRKNHIFVFLILYLSLMTTAYRFTIRPDIFSMLFLTLYLLIIKEFTEYKSKAIWLLPLLQILWVNSHGFYFIGPLIILIFLIGELVKNSARLPFDWNNAQSLDNHQYMQLLIIFFLMLVASFVNPYGITGAAYPLSVLGQISGKGKLVFKYIQELAKPITFSNILDFRHFTFYKTFILVSLFGFRFNYKNLNITHFLLWLSFLIFSFVAIRNIAYFSIIAAFVTFVNFNTSMEKGKTLPFKFTRAGMRFIVFLISMAFLFYYPAKAAYSYLNGSFFNFDTYELKSVLWGVSEQHFPKKAVDFVLEHNLPQPMFNDFNSGSYLIGRAYPLRLVYIDGRTELYGPDFFTNYVSIVKGDKDLLEEQVLRYAITGFFLTTSANNLHLGLMKNLFNDRLWKVIYFDETAVIFLKDTKENAPFIREFGIDLKKWTPQEPDFEKIGIKHRYPLPFVQRARTLNSLGCYEASLKEAKIALEIMPNNAEALKYTADYYFQAQDYKEALKFVRSSLINAPGDLQARSQLALIYHFLEDDEKSLKVTDSIIKNNPKFSQGYYVKALILKESDAKTAKELLKKACELSPEEPKYHTTLADLLMEEGDLTSAKKEWEAAFKYDSANEYLKKKLKR